MEVTFGTKWPIAVVIDSTRDDVVAGLSPAYDEVAREVSWIEGNHRRVFTLKPGTDPELGGSSFEFEDDQGEKHELFPMTLELYEKVVRPRTLGKPTFSTLEQLIDAMRREW